MDRRFAGMASFLVACAATRAAGAVDTWLVPRTPVVRDLDEARDIPASLLVGHQFVADVERPFERARAERLTLSHRGAVRDLLPTAREGDLPFLHLHLEAEGGYLIALDRSNRTLEMPAHEFEAYLHNQGFADALADRDRRGRSNAPGRERYGNYLKALVQVGQARDDTYRAVIGQTIEIVPESDPVQAAPGTAVPVLVTYRGQPLAGAKLGALSRGDSGVLADVYTTDDRGMASVAIHRRGLWLLRVAHMVPCEACTDADWESFWASYLFATANPDGQPVIAPPIHAAPARSAMDFVITLAILGASLGLIAVSPWLWRRKRPRA